MFSEVYDMLVADMRFFADSNTLLFNFSQSNYWKLEWIYKGNNIFLSDEADLDQGQWREVYDDVNQHEQITSCEVNNGTDTGGTHVHWCVITNSNQKYYWFSRFILLTPFNLITT